MVERIHGKANAGQSLTGGLDFIKVRTTLDIRAGAFGSESQKRLDTLVQVISTRAQPVILRDVVVASETDPADLPAASGAVDVYTLEFAIEHRGAWTIASNDPTLAESLDGLEGFVYDFANTTNNNVAVEAVVTY